MKSGTRLWLAAAAAVLPLALVAGLLVYVAVLTQCETETGQGSRVDLSAVPAGPIGAMGWRGEQLVNAAYVINAGADLGLSRRDQTIAVMTAMGESSLTVIDHGDAAGPDSRGLFQQRARGWGSYECRMNPTCSAQSFYRALMKVDGRDSMRPTIVAHTVQVNADAEHYTRFWPDAEQAVAALAGATSPVSDGSLALRNVPDGTPGSITVMSYNLLGQGLSRVKWPTRAAAITRLIRSASPDVLGVQENHQYRGQGQAQLLDLPGMTWIMPDHRNAIAVRSSLGQAIDQGTIRLATMGIFGAYHDRFATWAKIRTATGVLLVVNVHTENGNNRRAAKVRSYGYDRLLSGLARINPGNAIPTIMTGDFNASNTETRPLYSDHLVKLRAAGFVDAARQAPNQTKIAGVKSYNGLKSKPGKVRTGKRAGHLDYVWTAGDARATGWQIALPTITWRSIHGKKVPFVTEVTSDHWPTVAQVASGAAVDLGDCNPQGGDGGPLPGFDGASCVPSGSAAESGLQATARRGLRCIASAFPQIKSMGGRRSGGSSTCSFSDHCTGLAVDFMVPHWNTPQGKALGWRIARWVQANSKALNVKMVIWDARKWNPAANNEWRDYVHPYGNRNATLAHRDHVHVSFLAASPGN